MSILLPESRRSYGYVVGRVVEAIADTPNDPDPYPEARGVVGTVTFFPDVILEKIVDVDYTAFVVRREWTFELGSDGSLMDAEGNPGVYLLVGTWQVQFNIGSGKIDPFPILVKDTHTPENPLQLVSATPAPIPPNVTLTSIPVPPGGEPGDILVRTTAGTLGWQTGPIVKSPDGSQWALRVSDTGELTTEKLVA